MAEPLTTALAPAPEVAVTVQEEEEGGGGGGGAKPGATDRDGGDAGVPSIQLPDRPSLAKKWPPLRSAPSTGLPCLTH